MNFKNQPDMFGDETETLTSTGMEPETNFSFAQEPIKQVDTRRNEKILILALRVLSEKAFLFISLFGALALFGWAAFRETTATMVAAGAYSMIVFLPVLYRYFKSDR